MGKGVYVQFALAVWLPCPWYIDAQDEEHLRRRRAPLSTGSEGSRRLRDRWWSPGGFVSLSILDRQEKTRVNKRRHVPLRVDLRARVLGRGCSRLGLVDEQDLRGSAKRGGCFLLHHDQKTRRGW